MNDGSAWQASILKIRNVAAVAKSGILKVPRHLVIQVPKTKLIVKTHPGNTTGGGRFKIHCDGMDNLGKLNTKMPDVMVILNKKSHVYEIRSITIHTLKLVRKPASGALPVVGKNVTNDPKHRVRTPEDKPEGKGYWQDVIKNMEGYQYGGDTNRHPPALKWYAKGSTDFHEEVHNQQFRAWLKKNTFFILRKVEQKAGGRLKNLTRLNKKDVVKAAQEAVKSLIPEGYGDGDADEKEAYTKTYRKIWVPVIQKIKADAGKAGWVTDKAK